MISIPGCITLVVILASGLCSRSEENLGIGAPFGAFFVDQNYLKNYNAVVFEEELTTCSANKSS